EIAGRMVGADRREVGARPRRRWERRAIHTMTRKALELREHVTAAVFVAGRRREAPAARYSAALVQLLHRRVNRATAFLTAAVASRVSSRRRFAEHGGTPEHDEREDRLRSHVPRQ